jgi:Phosphotransferase enzyme family
VLVPPQAERFATLVGVDLDRLVLNVTGWNKLVLLDSERVFLFPRSAAGVEWFERELAVYRALADTRLSVVPRLLGYWEDPEIYPFPFAAVSRLRGEAPAETEVLAEQLGRAPSPAGTRSSRLRLLEHARPLTTTPPSSAGCAGLWTQLGAKKRPARPPSAWASQVALRRGRTCSAVPPRLRRSSSTVTFTKASCSSTAAG